VQGLLNEANNIEQKESKEQQALRQAARQQQDQILIKRVKNKFLSDFIIEISTNLENINPPIDEARKEAILDNILYFIANNNLDKQEYVNKEYIAILQDIVNEFSNIQEVGELHTETYLRNHLNQCKEVEKVNEALLNPNVNTQIPPKLKDLIRQQLGLPQESKKNPDKIKSTANSSSQVLASSSSSSSSDQQAQTEESMDIDTPSSQSSANTSKKRSRDDANGDNKDIPNPASKKAKIEKKTTQQQMLH
jgi:cobalamin biosynthesis Mg chelatase CobN